jgi:amino acid transporter
MKEFTFGSKSWHLYLANYGRDRYDRFEKGEETDLCTYTRRVLVGMFWLSVVAIMVTIAATVTTVGLYDIVMYLFTDAQMNPCGIIISVLILATTILLTIFGIKQYLDKREKPLIPRIPEDSFVGLTYQRFKNKTCFKIKFQ